MRWWRRGISWAAALALLPAQAQALPMLRLFLDGEVRRLGSGGAAAFRDRQEEALRLERPSLLAGQERPALRFTIENEEILTLREGRYAGTEAYDRKLRITGLFPLRSLLGELPATLFVGVGRETGKLHLETRRNGAIIDSSESRDTVDVGVAAALPWGLSLAGMAGTSGDGGPTWLVEARYRPGPLVEAWFRRRSAAWNYELRVPDGAASKMDSPEVNYRIDDFQAETEFGAELGRRDVVWATGGVIAEIPNAFWLETGGRPLPWLALRAGADSEVFRFDDTMQAAGTGTIAEVDLGMRRDRYFGGIDADLGEGQVRARYVHTNLSGTSQGQEVGTAAARAFLQVDYDMGLFFRGGYRLEGHQLALGWDRPSEEGVGYSVGAQLFRMLLHPSDFAIQSDTLQRALAAEELRPARADLLGLTGALYVPLGRFRLSAAVGQYLPLSAQQERLATPPGSPPKPPDPSPEPPPRQQAPQREKGPYEWLTTTVGKALDGLSKYGGGNRLLFELSTEF